MTADGPVLMTRKREGAQMTRTAIAITGARAAMGGALALVLAGCATGPMLPGPAPVDSPVAVVPAPADDDPGFSGMGEVSASGAEQACIEAGRERGLDVTGVVGSSAVTGSNGEAARDVMLRVRRDGAEIEVRCNYVASTRMARIMLI